MQSTRENQNIKIRRSQRVLSNFIAQELLYDYMKGVLDSDRSQAMANYLATSPELTAELNLMREAEAFLKIMSQTKISPHHIDDLARIRTTPILIASRFKFSNWPTLLRWVVEALLISFAVAALALFIPWERLSNRISGPAPRASIHSGLPAVRLPLVPVPSAVTKEDPAPTTNTVLAKPAEPTPSKETFQETSADPMIAKKSSKAPGLNGFVYSMMMTSDTTEQTAAELKEKIETLGGTKAGQVELGWKKQNPSGSYFHFTLPSDKYKEFVETLGGYGRVRIYKNPHERIMPEGQFRIILWIQDNIVETQEDDQQQQQQQQQQQPEQQQQQDQE